MRFVLFCHSLVSDWNHGNAHFLRGIASELLSRGHEVVVFEAGDAWSKRNLIATCGAEALEGFRRAYPQLKPTYYDLATLDLDQALDKADVVLVHEWNPAELIKRLGEHRAKSQSYRLLFHDTHTRSPNDKQRVPSSALADFDGVLAFSATLLNQYEQEGFAKRAWLWHEAADIRVFRPYDDDVRSDDLVWIGNWGDDERTQDLRSFLLEPVKALRINATVYGVRYPSTGKEALKEAGITYGGWLANHAVPKVFGTSRATVHIPRRGLDRRANGAPHIQIFEALACGIPLVVAPWDDTDGIFRPGRDFLVANDVDDMREHLRDVIYDNDCAASLVTNGLQTIASGHTCAHRVDELLSIIRSLTSQAEPMRRLG